MTPQMLIDRGYITDSDYRTVSTLGRLDTNFTKGNITVRWSLNYNERGGHTPPCFECIINTRSRQVIELAYNRIMKKACIKYPYLHNY